MGQRWAFFSLGLLIEDALPVQPSAVRPCFGRHPAGTNAGHPIQILSTPKKVCAGRALHSGLMQGSPFC